MKSEKDSGRADKRPSVSADLKGRWQLRRFTAADWFALCFGGFLGLSLIKFGNPIILDSKVPVPVSLKDFWTDPWPPGWSVWLLLPLFIAGALLAVSTRARWKNSGLLWVLPLIWFGWQLLSASQTEDRQLTMATIWHFGGCLACYFLGAWLIGSERRLHFLLAGLLGAFAFSLVRAANQKLFEFSPEREFLLEGERAGWTNMPPELFFQMKQEGIIVHTNEIDIANPLLMAKYAKGRVYGTLVYPNALAAAELLLWPAAMSLAIYSTYRFRRLTRVLVRGVTFSLGSVVLFWTGSKSGWLITLMILATGLFRSNWQRKTKWAVLILLILVGLSAFGIRFRNYFASGATSIGARLDYWEAAVRTARMLPLFGSGPGTFQRPYARLKTPASEMARLTHNDYLEQFSDSGFVGGASYLLWIILLLYALRKRSWKSVNPLEFGLFLGVLGWFVQGISEFGLYIPALAWPAFSIAGSLLQLPGNEVDKATRLSLSCGR